MCGWCLCVSLSHAQGVLVGDMNDDDTLNITDVTMIVSTVLGKTEQRRVSPYDASSKSIIGTWYMNETTRLSFYEDGTTSYAKGYTYKYNENLGRILFYDTDNVLSYSEDVMEVNDDYLVLSPRGEKTFMYYYRTQELMKKATHGVLGHEYVDLGLSVRWATCNVGADTPDAVGDFLAWGETEAKASYTQASYLGTSADPVAANWGGTWRLPTETEVNELVNNCTWEWCDGVTKKYNGSSMPGYIVTSKDEMYEGNSIYIPACGYMTGAEVAYSGAKGSYWSSTSNYTNTSYVLHFTSTSVTGANPLRYVGRQVRGVSPRRQNVNGDDSFGLNF